MRSSPRPSSEDIAATSLWAVLLRSWLRVLIVSGFVGAITFAALAWLAQPYYAATVQLSVADDGAAGIKEALRSRVFAERILDELGLAKDPAFDAALAPDDLIGRLLRAAGISKPLQGEAASQRALATYQRSLRTFSSDGGRLVTIEFIAPAPEQARQVADRLAQMYLLEAASETPPRAPTIEPDGAVDIGKLAQDAADADAAVERFRSATGLGAKSGDAPAADARADEARMAELAAAVVAARRERDTAEARARAVRVLLDKGSVEAIPDEHPSPTLHELIAERVRVEVQKRAAEQILPAGHPRVRDLQVRLSELRWQMFREATTIADALDAQAAAAANRDGEARARLDHARADVRDAATDTAKLVRLEQEAAAKRRAFKAAQSGSEPARAEEAMRGAGAVALAAPAQASEVPISPRKGPLALLAAVSTLMIGFVIVIIRELLATGHRAPLRDHSAEPAAARQSAAARPPTRASAAASERDAAPVAGTAPEAPAGGGHFAIVSSTGDAARHVAALAATRRGYRTLLVADGVDGAGEARDLVSTLASSGRRSVLVDWSRDGKGVATSLGLLPAQPGINDLLAGHATFDDVIARLPDSDAHVVACGAPSAVDAALDPDWISLVLDALDEAYDHIVVVSRLEPARALFEAIEGRFDAGIVMSDRRTQGMNINAAPGVFLGFEVTDIYIVQLELAQRNALPPRRLKRGRRQAAA